MDIEIVVLAAGKGTRMKSALPKVLHPLAGVPMLGRVLQAASALSPRAIRVVAGFGASQVEAYVGSLPEEIRSRTSVVLQKEQLGTADAVACAMDKIGDSSLVLVLYGDTPLVQSGDLAEFARQCSGADIGILTATAPDPFGYGRIVRAEDGSFSCIVEEKDATPAQRLIREVNTGIVCARASVLRSALPEVRPSNAQGEYYLTDVPAIVRARGGKVVLFGARDFATLAGVNSNLQLAQAEAVLRQMNARALMEEGVTLADPARTDVRGTLRCGRDCFIDVNCIFEGSVRLGDNVSVGAGCVIRDCSIGDGSVISPYTVMEGSEIRRNATIGPFARLRPGNVLEDGVHIGDFVEVKKSRIGEGTKAGHLSYIGDAEFGRGINVGAGTITCNYDGANKHRTVVGDDVFIGSDTQLVAPVTVPAGVTIGAGTTYT
ncbi:MAG: bifunctional UDP-N-acetylglucosamine diphosphorylase/glucosamine-1-phosphate N-acetyltransferase GlmU, partial [Succinivibrio sp.]